MTALLKDTGYITGYVGFVRRVLAINKYEKLVVAVHFGTNVTFGHYNVPFYMKHKTRPHVDCCLVGSFMIANILH